MSALPDSPSSEYTFGSDDPADYWAEGDRPECNICRDFNPRYLQLDDTSNIHCYSSLLRSSRDGCVTCKMLEEIITGLYKFEDASTIAFNFADVSLRDILGYSRS